MGPFLLVQVETCSDQVCYECSLVNVLRRVCPQIIAAQEEMLRKERELEEARKRLAMIRQQQYKFMPSELREDGQEQWAWSGTLHTHTHTGWGNHSSYATSKKWTMYQDVYFKSHFYEHCHASFIVLLYFENMPHMQVIFNFYKDLFFFSVLDRVIRSAVVNACDHGRGQTVFVMSGKLSETTFGLSRFPFRSSALLTVDSVFPFSISFFLWQCGPVVQSLTLRWNNS